MKLTKRFIAFLMSIAMCMSMLATTAFAAEPKTTVDENVSGLNDVIQNLPDDALILYQDDQAILYQSHDQDIQPQSEGGFGYVDVPYSKYPDTGYFQVYNTVTGRMGVTWKIESKSEKDYARFWMTTTTSDIPILNTRNVYAKDGDVHLIVYNGQQGYYNVHYLPFFVEENNPMRLLCWTYSA